MSINFKLPITGLDFDKVSSLSQSQAGQDLFVIAVTQGKRYGRWLEIGAGHPIKGSNTWLLETEFSWTGDSIDIMDPVATQKQNAWNRYYSMVRSYFRNEIPQDWIESPSAITELAEHVQKELIREHDYYEIVDGLPDVIEPVSKGNNWSIQRPGARRIIADATIFDYSNIEGPYDYLQMDIDAPIGQLRILKSLLKKHTFSVITFEHDLWRMTEENFFCREESRKIMDDNGYILLVNDVTVPPGKGGGIADNPIYFEDWYVHTSRVDQSTIDIYKYITPALQPKYYQDILFR